MSTAKFQFGVSNQVFPGTKFTELLRQKKAFPVDSYFELINLGGEGKG